MKKLFILVLVLLVIVSCIFVTVACSNDKNIQCNDIVVEYDGKACNVLADNDYEGLFCYYYNGVGFEYSSENAPKEVGIYEVQISGNGYNHKTVRLEIKTMLEINEQNEIIGYTGTSNKIIIPNKNNNKAITKIAKLEICKKVNLVLSANITNVVGLKLAEGSEIEVFSENIVTFDNTCSFIGVEVSINEKSSYIADAFFKANDGIEKITLKSNLLNINSAILDSNIKEIVLKDKAILTEDLSNNALILTLIVNENTDSLNIIVTQTNLKNLKIVSVFKITLNESDFGFCNNLENLTIDGDVSILSNNGELNNVKLTLGESSSAINSNAFQNINFSKINLSENIKNIGSYAFSSNSILTEISLPNSLEIISEGLFLGCDNLKSIILGNNVIEIQSSAFGSTNIKEFTMPQSIEILGENIFAAGKLVNYKDMTNLTYIPKKMFSNCVELQSVELNDNIKILQSMAFYGCISLTLNLPSNLEKIDDYVFYNCKALNSVTLPKTLSSIGAGAISCYAEITNDSQSFKKINNFLLSADGKTLLQYYNNKSEVVELPMGVEYILEASFNFVYLKNIIVPTSLKELNANITNYTSIGKIVLAEDIDSLIPLKISANSIEFLSATPPKLGENSEFFNQVIEIIVPTSSKNLYKQAFETFENYNNIIAKLNSTFL